MQENPSRLFFIVSGEHPTLPLAELEAILEACGIAYRIVEASYKLVDVEAHIGDVSLVAARGGFTEEAGLEIFHSKANPSEIRDAMKDSSFENYLTGRESFSVRVSRFGGVSKQLSQVPLEAFLGGYLKERVGGRVDLRRPEKLFRGILSESRFHFGLVKYQRPRGIIASRRPRKRPAFHPSTMVPKLARCMVNLAGGGEGRTFLDPFCGVGGIALEACLVGCKVIAMDALRRMVRGTRRNLDHFGQEPLGLLIGDARHVPLTSVEVIATDPPYGTGASTLKSTVRRILEDFLPQARRLIPTGRKLVFASPLGTGAADVAGSTGFKVLGRHYVYVHRNLTREILVLEAV